MRNLRYGAKNRFYRDAVNCQQAVAQADDVQGAGIST